MTFVPPARHLLRAKDLADARYFEPLDVGGMAPAAGLSRAHFSRAFRKAFGESPHAYLLTRRLERAAALLRNTDHSVADICFSVGLVEHRLVHDKLQAHVRHVPGGLPRQVPAGGRVRRRAGVRGARPTAGRATAHVSRRRQRAGRISSVRCTDKRPEEHMIKIDNTQLWVHDQDEALDFYTKKLGMEVRQDVTHARDGQLPLAHRRPR